MCCRSKVEKDVTNSPGFYYFCARQFRQLSLFGLVRSFLFFLHIFLQQGKQKIRLSIIKYASNNLLTVAVLDPKQHINTLENTYQKRRRLVGNRRKHLRKHDKHIDKYFVSFVIEYDVPILMMFVCASEFLDEDLNIEELTCNK